MQPMLCFKLWQNLATGIIVLAIPKSQNTRVLGNGGIQNIGKPKTLGCQSSYTYYLPVRHMGCFRCHLIFFAVICPSHDDSPPLPPSLYPLCFGYPSHKTVCCKLWYRPHTRNQCFGDAQSTRDLRNGTVVSKI